MNDADPLQNLTGGYYALDLRVAPFEDGPTIDSQFCDYLSDTVYANTDAPMWMRASLQPSPYIRVRGEEPMPTDMIGLPTEWMEDLGIEDDNEYHTFYLCKPSQAHFVSQSILLGSTFEDDGDMT